MVHQGSRLRSSPVARGPSLRRLLHDERQRRAKARRHDFRRSIRRAVVHNHDADTQVLRQGTSNRLAYHLGTIVRRYNHRCLDRARSPTKQEKRPPRQLTREALFKPNKPIPASRSGLSRHELRCLHNLPGRDAPRAHTDGPAITSVVDDLERLEVRQPASACLVVCVRNVVTRCRAFSAAVANSCHCSMSCFLNSVLGRCVGT
jgi:hypothetical protein